MIVMDGRSAPGKRSWNLRIALTSVCNIRCRYCLPAGKQAVIAHPSYAEVVEVLRAAYEVGIRRVHYTGGEPTVRRDFVDILQTAKGIGFTQQIVTTNGSSLYRYMDMAVANGLTRTIVSLDTLDEQQNAFITRAKFFNATLRTVERAVELLPTMTKLSCVTMRSTLKEISKFIDYAAELNGRGHVGKLAIKLNQFFPSNPAQLSNEGETYWREEFVHEEAILAALAECGTLKPIRRSDIEGDNPSYNYFEVGGTGVNVGVLAMFSWNYPCGDCKKLRISPQGLATICISQKNPPVLWGMSYAEKLDTIKRLTDYRESDAFDVDFPNRHHYRPQLGELRFDKVVGPSREIHHFRDLLGGADPNAADAVVTPLDSFRRLNRDTRVRGVLLTHDNQLMLIRRTRPGQAPYWVFPGGGIEPYDRSAEACLRREVAEEVGGVIEILKLVYEHRRPHLDGGQQNELFFVCRLMQWDGRQTGPEFVEANGEYALELFPRDAKRLSSIDLRPEAVKNVLVAHGNRLEDLPDLRP